MKTVLITGASGEIGSKTAIEFAYRGYNVVIGYNKNEESAAKVKDIITSGGGSAIIIKADVTSEKEVERMFLLAQDSYGFVDVLVNNAGKSHIGLFTDMSLEQWEDIFRVNTTSAFLCSKCALEQMIIRKEGCIINISSIWGECGASCEVAYSASKAALIGLTKALAKEEGPSNIRINCIAPGLISSKMNSSLSREEIADFCEDTPLGRIGDAADVAQTALFLAENRFITGQVIGVNGGII